MSKKYLLILLILLSIVNSSFAKKIYVSKSTGSLGGDGSSGNPCVTISQALELATSGDEIYVLDGVFRERVRVVKSGIILTAANDEVAVTGTDLMTGFEDLGDGLYKKYAPNKITQLFVDGVPQVKAKFPNQSVKENLFDFSTIFVKRIGSKLTADEIGNFPDGYFNGATVWMLLGDRWVSLSAKVAKHTGNTLNLNSISYAYEGNGIAYISDCKNCLDNDGEWYWGNDTLYYKNSSIDISNSKIEGKTREKLFYLYKVENVVVDGFKGYGGNFIFEKTKNCKLINSNLKYLTDYDYLTGVYSYTRGKSTKPSTQGNGVGMFGVQDSVCNCEIAWSSGDGVSLYGENSCVYRCYIHDADYFANDCSAVSIGGYKNSIVRCELYNAGRDLISAGSAKRFKIKYNKLHDTGLLAWDLGIIYTWGDDGDEGEIAFNHIFNAFSGNPDYSWGAVGVYLDNGSRNYLVHHNVIHHIKGMGMQFNFPGNNLRAYNNTIYKTVRNMGAYGHDFPGVTPGDCKIFNNYSDKHLLTANWVESKKNLITNTDYLQDRDNENFLPKSGASLINKGMRVDELKDIPFSGKAPDLGAYEYGRIPWDVGPESTISATMEPKNLKDTAGHIMRGTPMVLAKELSGAVQFATDVKNWERIKNNGFNTIRVCWVGPWYNNHDKESWSVAEVLPYLDSCVSNATETGMNIIINFHNPGAQQEFDTEFAFDFEKEFWDSVAPRYNDNPLVYYEIVNEPTFNLDDYKKPAFKQNLMEIYKNVRVVAPEREILMFSFNTIESKVVEVVDEYKDSIDWDKTSVAYHMYNSGSSYAVNSLMSDYRVICTEWNYNFVSKLPGYEYIQQVDEFKENAQTLENMGSSWIDWRDWGDTTLNELLDTLIFDALQKEYWWGTPVAGTSVTGIHILKDTITVKWGTTKQLLAMVRPALAENQGILWSSSDTTLVAVNSSGQITSKISKAEYATITAETVESGFSVDCIVKVIPPQQKCAYPEGSSHTIPGVINATYFDLGGEGVGYHDLSTGNAGDGIRQDEGVDTENRLAEGTVGGIQTGEWLEYTVNVQEDGDYNFEILFATPGRMGKFHLEIDGINLTGSVFVKPTGSLNKFKPTIVENITLIKGEHILRIFFDFAYFNMGTITVKSSETSATDWVATNDEFQLYPNPATDVVHISGNISFDRYIVQSMTGQVIMQNVLQNNQINTLSLPKGNYIVVLVKDKYVVHKKLIKM
jgi:hypothetical protein